MKNSAATKLQHDCYHYYEKITRIMKLCVLLMFVAVLQVNANGYGQGSFTINNPAASVKKVFKEIESQSDYTLFYRLDQVDLDRKVKMEITNGSIDVVMNQLLQAQPLTYKLIGNVIVIKPATENAVASGAEQDIQQAAITGTVTSANTGELLAGVSVLEKNTGNGTTSNDKGHFSITVKEGAVLEFRHVGYKSKEITVGKQTTINVSLEEENKVLEQVVVVGYGTQKKKDLTGSVATISSKELENRANSQFGYSIEGKAAGVQVIRASGQPQAGFSIRIRGTSSVTSGSDPLYIVDGVPTSNTNDINPADIENITVLKDASSAAIYGNKGANGVVLITTKRGRNQKLKLNFNTAVTISNPWKKMKVLNSAQFKDLMTEMGRNTDWSKYNANTNWQDETFRSALSQNYQLSATGGTAKTSYYFSGSMNNQNGIILNNNVKRATLKANVDHQLTKQIKIGTTLSYDNWKDIDVPEDDRNGVIARLYTAAPIIGIRSIDKPEMYARSPFIDDIENPVATVYQPEHLFKNNRYHGNVYAEAELIPGLKIKSLFGFEKSDGLYTSFLDSIQTRYGKSLHGSSAENNYKYNYWISENTISYNKKIKDHGIALLGGFIISRGTSDNLSKSASNFSAAPAGNHSPDAGGTQTIPRAFYSRQSSASFIGRFNYAFRDKYLLTSNFRVDGSGKFAEKHRWGYFPSFSAGWRISSEEFFKEVKGVNELKFRAGWGIVGNDDIPSNSRFGFVDTTSSQYLINGVPHTAYIPTSLENIDLKWEKTTQFDFGIDLSLLNNRLSFTADYYYKKTTDMLLAVPLNTSSGFSLAWQNAGSLENRGFEFALSTKNVVSNNFKWNSNFNISFNKNKVLDIVGTTLAVGGITPAGDDFSTALVQAGMPLGSFYGKISQGVVIQTGMLSYMKTKDGSKDSVGIIGDANPKFMYGFTNGFTFKNFSLDIFFQGVYGNKILNATKILTESMAWPMNQSAEVLKRWKNPGDVTDMPAVSPENWANSNPSTRYLEDGSYLRLKSLTLGYSLPAKSLSKLKMSRCMFYVTAENLLTFTRYSGFDPEVSFFSKKNYGKTNQNTAPGVDFGTYPQSRDFILGVNISF